MTTSGVAATAASTHRAQPAGNPIGVIPPYSMPVADTASSRAAKEARRASRRRRTSPLTSTRVVARARHAAYRVTPARTPATTTQLAAVLRGRFMTEQKVAVSDTSGSISNTRTTSTS